MNLERESSLSERILHTAVWMMDANAGQCSRCQLHWPYPPHPTRYSILQRGDGAVDLLPGNAWQEETRCMGSQIHTSITFVCAMRMPLLASALTELVTSACGWGLGSVAGMGVSFVPLAGLAHKRAGQYTNHRW
jgi:hypothetical protein